jgi:hypothetical protein
MTLPHRCSISIDFAAKRTAPIQFDHLVDSLARAPRPFRCAAPQTAFLCCLLLCAWLGIVNLARAKSLEGNRIVDISSLSCADLLRMPLPQALITVGWIGGFYAGLKNDSRVNVLVFADDADQIIALCRKNESTSVMTLVERTFGLVRPPRP